MEERRGKAESFKLQGQGSLKKRGGKPKCVWCGVIKKETERSKGKGTGLLNSSEKQADPRSPRSHSPYTSGKE